jgi:hypothetical protein
MVVAMVALLVALGGTAGAASGLVTGAQIKNGTVNLADLSANAKSALKGKQGPRGLQGVAGPAGAAGAQGEKGEKGDTGAQGQQGPAAASGYEVRTWRYSKDDANSDMGPGYVGVGGGAIATVACSPGKVAVGGGYRFTSAGDSGFNSQALRDGSGVIASFPGRMDWSTNTVKPNNNTGWIVQVNDKVNAADMTLYVVCVNAN